MRTQKTKLWATMIQVTNSTKLAASSLHLPPVSMPRTTRRHRRLRMSSGYVRSFLRRASVKADPAYCPALRRGWPSLVRGETMVVSTASWAPPQMGRPFAIIGYWPLAKSSWTFWSQFGRRDVALIGSTFCWQYIIVWGIYAGSWQHAWRSGDLSGASGIKNLRVQRKSVCNTSTTTFNIHYACRTGIGNFGTDKTTQMAALPFVNSQHGQSTTIYELSFAKRCSGISG